MTLVVRKSAINSEENEEIRVKVARTQEIIQSSRHFFPIGNNETRYRGLTCA